MPSSSSCLLQFFFFFFGVVSDARLHGVSILIDHFLLKNPVLYILLRSFLTYNFIANFVVFSQTELKSTFLLDLDLVIWQCLVILRCLNDKI